MKFLLDHDVPIDISYSLSELGHEVVRLPEVLDLVCEFLKRDTHTVQSPLWTEQLLGQLRATSGHPICTHHPRSKEHT